MMRRPNNDGHADYNFLLWLALAAVGGLGLLAVGAVCLISILIGVIQ